MKNVASYALYGNRRFYWMFLPSLLRAHHNVFPGWELRIHHDSTIDAPRSAILKEAEKAGLCKLVPCGESRGFCHSMLWRLLPVWEEGVGHVICRDVDSLPTIKDRRCVEEWIQSGAAVHAINDNVSHTASLMGGMCGINAPRFRQITGFKSWDELIALGQDLDARMGGADQILLHYQVWMRCFPDACEHRIKGLGPTGCSCSRTAAPLTSPADVTPRMIEESDKFTPCLGAPGYNRDGAVQFFDEHGLPSIRKAMEVAEMSIKDKIVKNSLEPRKVVLMACNENKDYDFFLPMTAAMAHRVGYHPYFILVSNNRFEGDARTKLVLKKLNEMDAKFMFLPELPGFKSHTVAQVSRLFGGYLDLDDTTLVMTSDCDMWLLSQTFWADDDKRMTLWNFQNGYFLCYVRGTVAEWREVMGFAKYTPLHQALNAQLTQSLGYGKESWSHDEGLLCAKLKAWPKFESVRFVPREVDMVTSLPWGRVDRAGWDDTTRRYLYAPPPEVQAKIPNGPIDAHCIRPAWHPEYWAKTAAVFKHFRPDLINWVEEYHHEYMQTLGQS